MIIDKQKEDIVLKVSNLDVYRGNSNIIREAGFSIHKGDYVGIIGPNGGGKTTLILSILGEIEHEKGSIELFGQDTASFTQWDKVAYIPQNAIEFDYHFPLSVKELVSLGRVRKSNLFRRLNSQDWDKVNEAMDLMGISDLANRRIGQLSGGQKQRAFVAKALVRDPEVLFLDEPITGMDFETQERFYKTLSNLNLHRKLTILVVSHDLTAVFCRMSRVICVNNKVHDSEIRPDLDPNDFLQQAYGEHFHFVFHDHKCQGDFNGA
ncbi:metal ABC transporter ATP-binding protein [uncultured Methanolobus sp.]|uniref:metal ABC transporter ATP-binding protein n=1 Tax=uncultured Methanolobus sp. TaxID=218300 RepID=UPI002AAC364A|nr:metal ABC transporter ATP-binding protein [uncultured Methanolobus sp.]